MAPSLVYCGCVHFSSGCQEVVHSMSNVVQLPKPVHVNNLLGDDFILGGGGIIDGWQRWWWPLCHSLPPLPPPPGAAAGILGACSSKQLPEHLSIEKLHIGGHWSNGWRSDVVLGGRNFTLTFMCLPVRKCGCAGALSNSKMTFKDMPSCLWWHLA